MKKFLSAIFFLIFLFPSVVLANGAGLPSFFVINGKLSSPNPLQLYGITAQTFLIPQDYAPENYIINQPITFQVDEDKLSTVIPPQILQNTKFTWDFGDGVKTQGFINTHTYSKIGTYILILTLNIYEQPNTPPTQFIDSYLLNVLPYKNYQGLPKAVIKINNGFAGYPTKQQLNLNFNNQLSFDASGSNSSDKIVEYLWNFGDGQTSTQKYETHEYTNTYFKTVVLRVKDQNGFFSDSFVGLQNTPNASSVPLKTNRQNMIRRSIGDLTFDSLTAAVVLLTGVVLFRRMKLKKS